MRPVRLVRCFPAADKSMTSILLSETPLRLLEQMAKDIAKCNDPWARHWLVLPGKGRSEWVQRRWADVAGIASHSQIVDLRSLVEQAAADGRSPFSLDRLTLAVAAAIPSLTAKLPLPDGTDCSVVTAKVLAWSRQLADALDLGLLCRAGNAQWPGAPFLRELAEVPEVKAELACHLGKMRDEEFRSAASQWLDEWNEKSGIPKLWIQIDAGLPALLMHRLTTLLEILPEGQARLYMLSPSNTFWGYQKTGRQRNESKKWEDTEDAGPVLRPLGRQAQDLHNQSVDCFLTEGPGEIFLPSLETKGNLLGRLQESCRLAEVPEEKLKLSPGDGSFTVHNCRSPLRELEVCRDRILQALQEDKTLRPDDILVLLANTKEMVPLVAAALQPQESKAERLPVRVLGLGGAVKSPVAESLLLLLGAMGGRLGLQEIQALVEEPLIAETFGFNEAIEEGMDLIAWLKNAQFRWGLDQSERAKEQGEGEHRWNMAFALRRLALGAIAAGELRDAVLDGSAPLDRARGLSTAVLASLAFFAEQLWNFRKQWTAEPAREMKDWCELTKELCETFIGNGDQTEREHRIQILSSILPNLEASSPYGLKIGSDAWLRLLGAKLDGLTESQITGGGGVTVADLRHYAGTPARMVLVAGLGADLFPRREERPTWHPLAGSRQPGDPDQRDADRHALLLALLSCGDRFVVTFQGGSDEDDKLRPPSTSLADLLSAVDQVAEPADGILGKPAHAGILFRHGLNGCSPQAFRKDVSIYGQSRLPSEYAGALLLQQPHQSAYPGLWAGAPLPEISAMSGKSSCREIRLKDLTTLLVEPCRLFLERLGVHLPKEEEELERGDFLRPGTLHNWSLRDQLLRARLEKPDGIDGLRTRLIAAGDLPRGNYGEKTWQTVEDETPKVEGVELVPLNLPIDMEIADSQGRKWRLKDKAPAGWYQKRGALPNCETADYFSASSFDKKRTLKLKLELLCLAAAISGSRVTNVTAKFKESKKAKSFQAPQREKISGLLTSLVDLYALAQRLPLPFWPDAYEAMLPVGGDDDNPDELLGKGFAKWDPEDRSEYSSSSESEGLATRFAFRGLDNPFLWRPDVASLLRLPAPDQPLAWNLCLWIQKWESAFHDSL